MTFVGIGFDSHRLAVGRRLVLGGVQIPYERGLEGHSDADVLAHALTDALLGAAGMGDIGEHFPDTDERWRDADSIELLRHAVGLARVNVKASTGEGIGFVGRGEGVAALAVVGVRRAGEN